MLGLILETHKKYSFGKETTTIVHRYLLLRSTKYGIEKEPSHHSKIIKDQSSTINIVHSYITRMLSKKIKSAINPARIIKLGTKSQFPILLCNTSMAQQEETEREEYTWRGEWQVSSNSILYCRPTYGNSLHIVRKYRVSLKRKKNINPSYFRTPIKQK